MLSRMGTRTWVREACKCTNRSSTINTINHHPLIEAGLQGCVIITNIIKTIIICGL